MLRRASTLASIRQISTNSAGVHSTRIGHDAAQPAAVAMSAAVVIRLLCQQRAAHAMMARSAALARHAFALPSTSITAHHAILYPANIPVRRSPERERDRLLPGCPGRSHARRRSLSDCRTITLTRLQPLAGAVVVGHQHDLSGANQSGCDGRTQRRWRTLASVRVRHCCIVTRHRPYDP